MYMPPLAFPHPRLLCSLTLSLGLLLSAHAADSASTVNDDLGPYIGIGLGPSKLGPHHDGHDGAHGDKPKAVKVYGGYRLTETWGVEAGWAHLGGVRNDTTASDGSTTQHHGDANSLYLAGTGRLPLAHGFSLTGKAGVSMGRVRPKDSSDANFTLGGNKASVLIGVGAEYKVNHNVALTFDLDGYGKVSDTVKAGTATAGVRYSF